LILPLSTKLCCANADVKWAPKHRRKEKTYIL
jgi:hypothetical protein